MVKTSKRHVCGQDNFWALVLQKKVEFRKKLKTQTNVSSHHRPLSPGAPAVRAGQTWMMGTHCSRVFTASGKHTSL